MNPLQYPRVNRLRTRRNLPIERAGVNFVHGIVEEAGCLFKEINLQHDFGHDATILLVIDGEVQPREVALQIKSGKKYNLSKHCKIPVSTAHMAFWAEHDLSTLGVVYDPSTQTAHWIDLKAQAQSYRRSRETPASIGFRKSKWNRFDLSTFKSVLLPILMHRPPLLALDQAIEWCEDSDFDTHLMGVRSLLARHYPEKAAWNALIGMFKSRPADNMSHLVPAAFSKLLGNWDLSYSFTTKPLPRDTNEFASHAVRNIGVDGVAKLLEFLDHDEGFDFSRGTLGRAFLTIFEAQPEMHSTFQHIANDLRRRDSIRRWPSN